MVSIRCAKRLLLVREGYEGVEAPLEAFVAVEEVLSDFFGAELLFDDSLEVDEESDVEELESEEDDSLEPEPSELLDGVLADVEELDDEDRASFL